MCRIEERVYVRPDGRESVFEETTRCHLAPRKGFCSNVKRSTKRYHTPPDISRHSSNSPASNNPPTPPTGPASGYMVEHRRPSQPSKEDKRIRPEIIINVGGSRKDKKYPCKKSYKRSSLASVASSDNAIESPGSDTIRTGFPDTPIISHNDHAGYSTRTTVPQVSHRHTTSASSYTSSQTPSLVATSDPESPSSRQRPRYPPTLVHNPPAAASTMGPPSPVTTRAGGATATPPSPYRTHIIAPSNSSGESLGHVPTSVNPFDYQDPPAPNRTHTYHHGPLLPPRAAGPSTDVAPEITGRGAYREQMRQSSAEAAARKKIQEDADRARAEREQREQRLQKEKAENVKQVHFELDRATARERERALNKLANSQKDRADGREEARRQKNEREAQAERERLETLRREQARASKVDEDNKNREKRYSASTTRRVRRPSISHDDQATRDMLLNYEKEQMKTERANAEKLEQEERQANLIEQQKQPGYYNPRGNTVVINNEGPGIGRRGSVSGRRPSLSGGQPPVGFALGRSNSQRERRASIVVQPAPPTQLPPINTNQPTQSSQYSARPPSSSRANPPPFMQPSNSHSKYVRPGSARTSSHSFDNPFAQPPGRISQEHSQASSNENPFATYASTRRPTQNPDPWATDDLEHALPHTGHARQPSDDRHTIQGRGKEVLNRAANGGRSFGDRARQATMNMGKVVGYENDYESSSEEEDHTGYQHRRGGHGKAPVKRKP